MADPQQPYTPQPTPGGSPATSGMPVPSSSAIPPGFINRLFDMSFSSFITPTIVKILYILFLVVVTLGSLIFLIGGLAQGGAAAVLFLILTPVVFLFYVILARVYMEIIIVLFRLLEAAQEIARNTRNRTF